MEYAEVKVVLDEKKIAEVGKYPVDYITTKGLRKAKLSLPRLLSRCKPMEQWQTLLKLPPTQNFVRRCTRSTASNNSATAGN